MLQLKLTLKRCQTRESLDSCEVYQTITVNHLCDLLNPDEKKPWSPFLKQVHPHFKCPLKKVLPIWMLTLLYLNSFFRGCMQRKMVLSTVRHFPLFQFPDGIGRCWRERMTMSPMNSFYVLKSRVRLFQLYKIID